jgi:hypothetical protein
MHELQNRPLYKWTSYTLEQRRIAEERRHAIALFLGALTALVCAALVYVVG